MSDAADNYTKRQKLFAENGMRYYGDSGMVHGTTDVNVELHNGKVVAVWFRCTALQFTQNECGRERAEEMRRMYADVQLPELHGLELRDPKRKGDAP